MKNLKISFYKMNFTQWEVNCNLLRDKPYKPCALSHGFFLYSPRFFIYIGQVLFFDKKCPQLYTHNKYSNTNISTDFSTLSTIKNYFTHIYLCKTRYYILNNHKLYTSYQHFVHKYGCSLFYFSSYLWIIF